MKAHVRSALRWSNHEQNTPRCINTQCTCKNTSRVHLISSCINCKIAESTERLGVNYSNFDSASINAERNHKAREQTEETRLDKKARRP